jgi:two-component system, NarL family, sensor histidine kinase DegS
MILRIEKEEQFRLKMRFMSRAQAVFWVRISSLLLGFIFLWMNHFQPQIFQNPLHQKAHICLVLLLLSAICSYFLAAHDKYGRRVYFFTLCLELIWSAYLIIFSGGIFSLLMVFLPIYTLLFSILFHSFFALSPPLLLLPIITAFSSIASTEKPDSILLQIGVLGIYTILNGAVIYVTNSILSREESQSREIFRLERRLKKMATLEERTRLSREIHDGLGSALSSLIIQSEYLLAISEPYPKILKELRELRSSAEEAIDEVRRTLCMMRNEFDLIPQLQNCCTTFSTRHRLPTHIEIKGKPPSFSSEKQLTIFRIMQECLSNTSKHANAKKVDVQIHFSENALNMRIRDDGKGFDPKIIFKNHFGLLGIQERARKIGGDVVVESIIGEGTCIHVQLTR